MLNLSGHMNWDRLLNRADKNSLRAARGNDATEKVTSRFSGGRASIFWLLDVLHGSPVHKHLSDIVEFHRIREFGERAQNVRTRLKNILEIACRKTEYYKAYSSVDGLSNFPVVNKTTIRRNPGAFVSSSYSKRDLIPAVTSGSTGTPFITYQSKGKKSRNVADTLYLAHLGGYELGNRLFYFKIWSDLNRKSAATQVMQNIVPIDVINLKANVGQVVDQLNKSRSSVCILGYVSALETLFRELEDSNRLNPAVRVNSIITMSEALNDYTKEAGERLLGCPVLSRYSNIENGIIAQQTFVERSNLVINSASYFVEILKMENDEVLPNGSLGRIVVTDFFNDAMPMIRYDTGDLGVLEDIESAGSHLTVLTRVEGRKLDQIFDTKGNLVSSYVVYKNMWKYTEIEQYQLIQKSAGEYLFKISMPNKFERERELVDEFKSYLGRDAEFRVEYVQEIPVLASGKRQKVVNEVAS